MDILLNSLASKIVNHLDPENVKSDLDRIKMNYGVQILLNNLFSSIIIIAASIMTGLTIRTVFALIIFASLRFKCGGAHCNSAGKCLFLTSSIILGGAFLSIYIVFHPIELLLIFILQLAIAIKYTPRGTAQNPIAEEDKFNTKIAVIILLVIYFVLACFISQFRSLILLEGSFALLTTIPLFNKQLTEY